jgi:hypothetical protein
MLNHITVFTSSQEWNLDEEVHFYINQESYSDREITPTALDKSLQIHHTD